MLARTGRHVAYTVVQAHAKPAVVIAGWSALQCVSGGWGGAAAGGAGASLWERRAFSATKVEVKVDTTANATGASETTFESTTTETSTEQPKTFQDPRGAILDAALTYVPTKGWTRDALAAGALALGFPPTTQGVFPNGDADLVHHFMFRANEYMAVHLSTLPLKDMTVNERIKAGVKARLEYIIPVVNQWPQAMGIGALPQNLPRTLQLLLDMADEIWHSAGDRSADFTWYTRRGLLIGVYTATELCMLTDKSAGYRDTWEFLDRRLKDVSSFGQQVGEADAIANAVGKGVMALATSVLSLAQPVLPPNFDPVVALREVVSQAATVANKVAGQAGSVASTMAAGARSDATGAPTTAAGPTDSAVPHPPSATSAAGTPDAATAAASAAAKVAAAPPA